MWDLLPAGKQLGGAPTNFAFHAQQLGLQSAIISSVQLDENGIPNYVIYEDVAWDFISPSKAALQFAKQSRAIYFGTLAQRSETSCCSIQEVLKTLPENALKVFDQ